MVLSANIIFEGKTHHRLLQSESSTAAPHTLSSDNEAFFEQVFKEHFKGLFGYAMSIVKDDVMAEELVQNVFCKLWEKQEQIDISQSFAAYLYRSVYNECLNYLKHLKVRAQHQAHVKHMATHTEHADNYTAHRELQKKLQQSLSELPEQCRTVFQLSRFEELKYQEIADKLGISIKTVENHMGKALRLLRQKLADFLPVILVFIYSIFNR